MLLLEGETGCSLVIVLVGNRESVPTFCFLVGLG